jgi:hypothetical protein
MCPGLDDFHNRIRGLAMCIRELMNLLLATVASLLLLQPAFGQAAPP